MQKIIALFSFIFFIASGFTAYGPGEKATYTVVAEQSEVHWYAKKVTGAHDGVVTLKRGNLDLEDGRLVGGNFVVDMTSIKVSDLEEGSSSNVKLTGHLKSADFFDVEDHQEAKLVMTKIEKTGKQAISDKAQEYKVQADLTIKGKTSPVEFLAYVKTEGDQVSARAKDVTFDRTKYDIRYGSETFFGNLGDKAIYDEVRLSVDLMAKKAS